VLSSFHWGDPTVLVTASGWSEPREACLPQYSTLRPAAQFAGSDLLSPGAGGDGVQHLVTGEAVWELPATPALGKWHRQRQATPKDDLIVRVLDVETHCHAISLARRADRDEAAISTRNRALADAAETVLRAGRPPMPGPGDESPVGWLVPGSGRRNRRRLSGWRGYGAASPAT
jgi:hypothetical protein